MVSKEITVEPLLLDTDLAVIKKYVGARMGGKERDTLKVAPEGWNCDFGVYRLVYYDRDGAERISRHRS